MKRPAIPAYHWQGDGSEIESRKLEDLAALVAFCDRLLVMMDVQKLGPITAYQETSEAKVWGPGVTLLAPIIDSNVVIHTLSNAGVAFIDVFSCKPLKRRHLQAYAERYFGGKWRDRMIIRGRKSWRFW